MTSRPTFLRAPLRAAVRSPKRRRFLPLLSLGISIAALLVALDARNGALQANRATRSLRDDTRGAVIQVNSAHESYRYERSSNKQSIEQCHRRVSLVAAALDAVAKTQPGRSRAPYWLAKANALAPP